MKNLYLESKIIKIGQCIPEFWLLFKNILKIVNFAAWSGKRWKLSQEAQVDFLTTFSAQNSCLDIGYNMKYVWKASSQYIKCYNPIFEPS